MDVLMYLIPLALLIVMLGIFGVFWCVNNNQFEDMEGAAQRILMRDKDEEACE